jgi:hypothetical protein
MTAHLMLVALVLGGDGSPAPSASLPPRPLFAAEKWYQDAPGPERTFAGRVEANAGLGKIGLPARFHSFILHWVDDGKVVQTPVHMAGQDHLLAPFVGQSVRIVGKLVESEQDGKKLAELWPAKIESMGVGAALGEWKVLARADQGTFPVIRLQTRPSSAVIRDAATLGREVSNTLGNRMDPAQVTNFLALSLRRKRIDWAKEMVLCVAGGQQQVPGTRVEISRIVVDDTGMNVYWRLIQPKAVAPANPGMRFQVGVSYPSDTVLVDRFDGEVRFHQEDANAAAPANQPARPG